MARSRYCRICQDFHDLAEAWPEACVGHFASSATDTGVHIISDSIEPFRSQADGKVYDSKSRYRRDLKARGLVEVGNDRVERRPQAMPPVRDTLRSVIQQLRG